MRNPSRSSARLNRLVSLAVGELIARCQNRSRQYAFKRMWQVAIDQPALVRHVGGKMQVPQWLQRLGANPKHCPAEEIELELVGGHPHTFSNLQRQRSISRPGEILGIASLRQSEHFR